MRPEAEPIFEAYEFEILILLSYCAKLIFYAYSMNSLETNTKFRSKLLGSTEPVTLTLAPPVLATSSIEKGGSNQQSAFYIITNFVTFLRS